MDDFLEDFNQRQLLVLKIIHDQESINSMLVFQKLIYFMQSLKREQLDYEYIRYNFGPYSFDLQADLQTFADYGLIEIVTEDERESVRIRNKEEIDKILRTNKQTLQVGRNSILKENKIREFLQEHLVTPHNIELAASVHFLYHSEHRKTLPEIVQALDEWKPGKFSPTEIKETFAALREYSLLCPTKQITPRANSPREFKVKSSVNLQKNKPGRDLPVLPRQGAGQIKNQGNSKKGKKYDVVLSFAGEDRAIVKQIAVGLKKQGISFFYDGHEEANLWGKDLGDHFRRTYGPNTRFVLIFVSRHYVKKDWTDFELQIAREEAKKREQEFILPIRLDDSKIAGLKSTMGFLDWRKKTPADIVRLVKEKLNAEI